MSDMVVEIHVPLVPAEGIAEGEYQFSWIDTVMDHLVMLEGDGGEMYDDGEELGDEYLFFVWAAPEEQLLARATEVSQLSGVPSGVYAIVTTSDAEEMGIGRRVNL